MDPAREFAHAVQRVFGLPCFYTAGGTDNDGWTTDPAPHVGLCDRLTAAVEVHRTTHRRRVLEECKKAIEQGVGCACSFALCEHDADRVEYARRIAGLGAAL